MSSRRSLEERSLLTRPNLIDFLGRVKKRVSDWRKSKRKSRDDLSDASLLVSRLEAIVSRYDQCTQQHTVLPADDQECLRELGFRDVNRVPRVSPKGRKRQMASGRKRKRSPAKQRQAADAVDEPGIDDDQAMVDMVMGMPTAIDALTSPLSEEEGIGNPGSSNDLLQRLAEEVARGEAELSQDFDNLRGRMQFRAPEDDDDDDVTSDATSPVAVVPSVPPKDHSPSRADGGQVMSEQATPLLDLEAYLREFEETSRAQEAEAARNAEMMRMVKTMMAERDGPSTQEEQQQPPPPPPPLVLNVVDELSSRPKPSAEAPLTTPTMRSLTSLGGASSSSAASEGNAGPLPSSAIDPLASSKRIVNAMVPADPTVTMVNEAELANETMARYENELVHTLSQLDPLAGGPLPELLPGLAPVPPATVASLLDEPVHAVAAALDTAKEPAPVAAVTAPAKPSSLSGLFMQQQTPLRLLPDDDTEDAAAIPISPSAASESTSARPAPTPTTAVESAAGDTDDDRRRLRESFGRYLLDDLLAGGESGGEQGPTGQGEKRRRMVEMLLEEYSKHDDGHLTTSVSKKASLREELMGAMVRMRDVRLEKEIEGLKEMILKIAQKEHSAAGLPPADVVGAPSEDEEKAAADPTTQVTASSQVSDSIAAAAAASSSPPPPAAAPSSDDFLGRKKRRKRPRRKVSQQSPGRVPAEYDSLLLRTIKEENALLRHFIVRMKEEMGTRKEILEAECDRLKQLVGESALLGMHHKSGAGPHIGVLPIKESELERLSECEMRLIQCEHHLVSPPTYYPDDINDPIDHAVAKLLGSISTCGGVRIEIEKVGKGKYLADRLLLLDLMESQSNGGEGKVVMIRNVGGGMALRNYLCELYAPFLSEEEMRRHKAMTGRGKGGPADREEELRAGSGGIEDEEVAQLIRRVNAVPDEDDDASLYAAASASAVPSTATRGAPSHQQYPVLLPDPAFEGQTDSFVVRHAPPPSYSSAGTMPSGMRNDDDDDTLLLSKNALLQKIEFERQFKERSEAASPPRRRSRGRRRGRGRRRRRGADGAGGRSVTFAETAPVMAPVRQMQQQRLPAARSARGAPHRRRRRDPYARARSAGRLRLNVAPQTHVLDANWPGHTKTSRARLQRAQRLRGQMKVNRSTQVVVRNARRQYEADKYFANKSFY